jgi:DNA relaxation protein homolog
MAILKSVNNISHSLKGLKNVLNYITNGDKNRIFDITGIGLNDNKDIAFNEMVVNKKGHDNLLGRQYKQFILAFPVGIDPQVAHKIGIEFAEEELEKRGYKSIIATHTDKAHPHVHIVCDSVNNITGKKFHEIERKALDREINRYKNYNKDIDTSEVVLEDLKESFDQKCLEYGIQPIKKGKTYSKNIWNKDQYTTISKEDSFRNKIAKAYEEVALMPSTNKNNVFDRLKKYGIEIAERDGKKQFDFEKKKLSLEITYTDKNGVEKKGRCRLSTLAKEEDFRFNSTENVYNFDFVFNREIAIEKEKETEKVKDYEFNVTLEEIKKELEKENEVSSEKELKDEIYNFFSVPVSIKMEQAKEVLNSLKEEKNEILVNKMLEVLPDVFGNSNSKRIGAWDFEPLMEKVLEVRKDELKKLFDKPKSNKNNDEEVMDLKTFLSLGTDSFETETKEKETKKEFTYTPSAKKEETKEKEMEKEFTYTFSKAEEPKEEEKKVEETKKVEEVKIERTVETKKKTKKEIKNEIYNFIEQQDNLSLMQFNNLLEDIRNNENSQIIDEMIQVLPELVENIDGYKTIVTEDFKNNMEIKLNDTIDDDLEEDHINRKEKGFDYEYR